MKLRIKNLIWSLSWKYCKDYLLSMEQESYHSGFIKGEDAGYIRGYENGKAEVKSPIITTATIVLHETDAYVDFTGWLERNHSIFMKRFRHKNKDGNSFEAARRLLHRHVDEEIEPLPCIQFRER